jgi:redox-sensitive bicupin YhaK (pirin superfamily)
MMIQTLQAHTKDLGDGFEVRRLLPAAARRNVGPFIFFDHMGPVQFNPGQAIDVRPHPHIGLATVTYLFEGALMHRDSLGFVQRITPGDVNWMTAGNGIVHSERSPDDERNIARGLHGIQVWIALPLADEQTEPAFTHHPKASLPRLTLPAAELRLIAGSGWGLQAPVRTFSPMFYAAIEAAGAALADDAMRRILVVDDESTIRLALSRFLRTRGGARMGGSGTSARSVSASCSGGWTGQGHPNTSGSSPLVRRDTIMTSF